MAPVILVGAILAWGAVHSWLASLAAKRAWGRILGDPGSRVYRLAYNAWALVSFTPVVWLMLVLPDRVLYLVAAPWRYVMIIAEIAAGGLLGLALLETDALHFAGLRQIMAAETPSRLVTGGFYAWVRHPLYLFGLLVLWLTPFMTLNMLTVFSALTAYIFLGAWFEERRLLRAFGQEYRDYQARTPMLIPGLRLRSGPPRQSNTSPKD